MDREELLTAIGARVRQARERRGWSQTELAVAADSNIMSISKIERGAVSTSVTNLVSLAEALEVTPSWLLEGGEEIPRSGVRPRVYAAFKEFLHTPQAHAASPEHLAELRERRYQGEPSVVTYALALSELQSVVPSEQTKRGSATA